MCVSTTRRPLRCYYLKKYCSKKNMQWNALFPSNSRIINVSLTVWYISFLFCPVDVSPLVLAELVVKIRSTRLKLGIADAIFRSLCCKNGFTVGEEPLSLKKMVCVWVFLILHLISHYLPIGNLIAFFRLVFMTDFVQDWSHELVWITIALCCKSSWPPFQKLQKNNFSF